MLWYENARAYSELLVELEEVFPSKYFRFTKEFDENGRARYHIQHFKHENCHCFENQP